MECPAAANDETFPNRSAVSTLRARGWQPGPERSGLGGPRATGGGGRSKLVAVLGPGSSVPDVPVWTSPREEAQPLREVLGEGLSLLCFYLWDWSPT